jgi:hypothetical protein
MIPHSAPIELGLSGARLNFTFRHAPDIIGQEDDFNHVESGKGKNCQLYRL